jgi:hypothetical protein
MKTLEEIERKAWNITLDARSKARDILKNTAIVEDTYKYRLSKLGIEVDGMNVYYEEWKQGGCWYMQCSLTIPPSLDDYEARQAIGKILKASLHGHTYDDDCPFLGEPDKHAADHGGVDFPPALPGYSKDKPRIWDYSKQPLEIGYSISTIL